VEPSQPPSSGAVVMDELMDDDYHMMDMSDTLFSSLSTPALSAPRDLCTSHLLRWMAQQLFVYFVAVVAW